MSFDRFTHEREWLAKGCQRIAGVDEVGRGPLAGPVVAAAAVFSVAAIQAGLPEPLSEVNDSKKLSAKKRDTLYEALNEFSGVEFAFADLRNVGPWCCYGDKRSLSTHGRSN